MNAKLNWRSAMIVEVSFVSFKFVRYEGALWDLCEC